MQRLKIYGKAKDENLLKSLGIIIKEVVIRRDHIEYRCEVPKEAMRKLSNYWGKLSWEIDK